MLAGHAVQVANALEQVTDYWSPRIVGQVNDQYIKVAKLKENSSGTTTRMRMSCSSWSTAA